MRFNSPLRYPGGKACIFEFVSALIKENHLLGTKYAEPYAGGAGLALRLLYEEYVEKIFINDLDKALYSFWATIISDADSFCSWIEDVNVSMDEWRYYKDVYDKGVDDLGELAKATFFLNRTNISGILMGGVIGGSDQSGKYKIGARFNKSDLISRVQKIYRFRSRISVSNLDGIDFLRYIDNSYNDLFIYVDPPYFQKGAELYMNYYKKDDHEKLSSYIKNVKNNWILSYDNHKFVLSLYEDVGKVTYKLSQSVSNRIGDEMLFFSKEINFNQSIRVLNSAVLL
ncbi:MAG: DNA adenine methylase [Bacteroidales bacterium]|nr:DNA adenine methylase [Bacteroidales bacterium]